MSSLPAIRWQLHVLDDAGSEVLISVDAPKCVGRGDERVDIRLLSGQVSRRHAEFFADAEGRLMIRDLKSTNGTGVNGQRIEGECALIHGDVVSIAHWAFTVRDQAAAVAVDAQRTEAPLSSAESMVAMDALLDSQGNLRHEDVAAPRAHAPAKQQVAKPQVAAQTAKQAAPQEVKQVPAAAADCSSTLMETALPARAPARPAPVSAPEPAPALMAEDAAGIAADSGFHLAAVGDFVDSQAGALLFGGSHFGVPALDDSSSGSAPKSGARASDLHLVGEGRAPGVSAADLCAVQAFADRQLIVPNAAKRRRLLCEFTTGPVFRKNLSAVVSVQDGGIGQVGDPVSSLPGVGLHIEKTLVRRAAQEKRAIVAWDAHFQGGASAVAVCCPLSGGEFLYAVTTFENATPAWMALLAQTAFMDRLIRKSWAAIDKVRRPAALPMGAAA